ncbi:MAG: pyridoxal phosphate-dependent transferase [Monoraphidium minutum]|nr:MAG: pyridoxal phosphate-dependent transferase [Monoraphidium minutum]
MTHANGESVVSVDWDSLWSTQAKMLRPARVASIVERFSGVPGVVGMHGGLPPADTFPVASFHMDLAPIAGGGALAMAGPKDTVAAQQYCFSPNGYEPLRAKLHELTVAMQRPPAPIQVTVTAGSTYALHVVLDLLLERGDPLLLEEYTYSHALEAQLMPKGYELLPVAIDEEGLVPSALDALLAARAATGARMPRAVYTIPSGQNPTGAAMGPGRRAAVYEVCRRWGLVIVEDDAYSWLQYPRGEGDVPGVDGLQPGLLSLDTDGRVIRLDTFSKLLGPGLRLGWMTAPPPFAARAALAISASTLGPASVSTVYMARLLDHWGASGLDSFVSELQRKYARAAAAAHAAAGRHLDGLATWRRPTGGMFMWLKLVGLDDSMELLEAGPAAKVAVVPGSIFSVAAAAAAAGGGCGGAAARGAAANGAAANNGCGNGHAGNGNGHAANGNGHAANGGAAADAAREPPCPYFRVSFVSVPEAEIEEGFARLGRAIRTIHAKHAAASGAPAPAANGA